MSTCSQAPKPGRGTLGPWVLVPYPAPPDPKKSLEAGGSLHQTRRSQVSPASQHPPVRAALPKTNTSPAGIRGGPATTTHRPGLWNAQMPSGPHRNPQSCRVKGGGAPSLKVAFSGPPPAWQGSGIW